jgi:exosome complex component RRP42
MCDISFAFNHGEACIQDGEKYAQELFTALNAKLRDEDVRRDQKARNRFARR